MTKARAGREEAARVARIRGDSQSQLYTAKQRSRHIPEKKGIAKYVVKDAIGAGGLSIFLDAGSTVQYVAEELFNLEARATQKLACTMLTNNLGIFNAFNHYQVQLTGVNTLVLLLTGGTFDANHDALFGFVARESLKLFSPHVTIIGTSGFKFDEGLFFHGDTPEWAVKQAVCSLATGHRIIVCDHTKMGERDAFPSMKHDQLLTDCKKCTVVTSYPPEAEYDQYAPVLRQQKACFEDLRQCLIEDGHPAADQFNFVIVDKDGEPQELS